MASYQGGKWMCAGLQGSNQGFSLLESNDYESIVTQCNHDFFSPHFSLWHSSHPSGMERLQIVTQNATMMWEFLFSSQIRNHLAIPDWFSFSDICSLSWFRSVFGRESTATYLLLKYSAKVEVPEVFCKVRFLWRKKVFCKSRFLWKKYSATADFFEEKKYSANADFSEKKVFWKGRFVWKQKTYSTKANFSGKSILQR